MFAEQATTGRVYMTDIRRRDFVRTVGIAAVPTVLGSRRALASSGDGWTVADSPTSRTLYDAVHTDSGVFAVGAGGVVVAVGEHGWRLAVENGPTANGNNLSSAATTDGGERLWMAGASGVVGEYDPATGEMTSRSAPDGVTDTFTDIAVTGSAGDATVYLCDTSGRVHVSEANGREGTWTHATPGSGAEITAIAVSDSTGVLVDRNKDVFRTTDGATWSKVETPDLGVSLHDVELSDSTIVLAGDGTVVAGSAGEWELESPTERSIQDVEIGRCGCVHAVGESGTVLHRMGHGTPGLRTLARWLDWWERTSPTGQNLHGFAIGPPHVAVGAAGTIIERGQSR